MAKDLVFVEYNDSYYEKIKGIYQSNQEYFRYQNPNIIMNEAMVKRMLKLDMNEKPDGVTSKDKHFNVVLDDDIVIGVCDFLTNYPSKKMLYVGLILVDGVLQGQGYGTRILEFIDKFCELNGIHVIQLASYEKNIDAIRLYKKNGYEVIEKVEKEATDDSIELIYIKMRKKLS